MHTQGSPIPKLLVVLIAAAFLSVSMAAQEIRLSLPKKSKTTPVQKLNRDGVKAIEDHDYKEAKKLFYKS